MPGGYLFTEHTSEIELELWGESMGELLMYAGEGLCELWLGDPPSSRAGGPDLAVLRRKKVKVESTDESALVVDWLNELLYLLESERFVPIRFDRLEVDRVCVSSEILGAVVQNVVQAVKAATYHAVDVTRVDGVLRAKVVLDV